MSSDFIQYWAAYHLLTSGQNPYDPALMLAMEQSAGFTGQVPMMMWTPPWAVLLMSPILCWDYTTAFWLWCVLNVFLVLACVALFRSIARVSHSKAFDLVLALLFFPAIEALRVGQISLCVLLGSLLVMRGVKEENPLLSGGGLLLALIKPHLGFFVLWYYTLSQLRMDKSGAAIRAAAVVLAVIGLTYFAWPVAYEGWLNGSLGFSAPGTTHPQQWISAVPSNALQIALTDSHGVAPVWPRPVGILVGLLGIWWYSLRLDQQSIRWVAGTATVLLISLLAAPYGWPFDMVLLLPAYLTLMGILWSRQHRLAVITLVAFNLWLALLAMSGSRSYDEFWPYPLALAGLYVFTVGIPRSPPLRVY